MPGSNIEPMSHMALESEQALVLKRIGYAVIPDQEAAQRNVGHGIYLKEQGFYPIGHKSGIIVLSYYDPVQQAIIYEKLVFSRIIHARHASFEAAKIQETERLILFEE